MSDQVDPYIIASLRGGITISTDVDGGGNGDFVIKTGNVERLRIDNDGIGSGLLGSLSYSVKDYGARGDGSTDDSAAITATIAATPVQGSNSGSGILYFPPGQYIHTGITIPANKRIRVMGAGAGVSVLYLKSGANADSLTLAARTGATDGWWQSVSHLTIDGNKAGNASGHGIVVASTRTQIHHCNITSCKQDGIHSDPASFALSSSGNSYHHLYIVSNDGDGLYLGTYANDPFLTDLFIYLNGGDGIESKTTNVFAKGIHVAENGGHGINLTGTTGGYGLWDAIYAHLNTSRGISISGVGETGHRFGNSQLIGNLAGGMYISTTNGRCGLFGSLVKDNTGPGVEVASCNFNMFVGNQFLDFQGPKTQTYGVVTTGTADYNTISDNTCRSADHLTGDLSLAGTHDTVIGNVAKPSTFVDRITASDGITHKLKAGTPADGDFIVTPADGTMVVDSTFGKIWVRLGGGTWKASEVLVGNPVANKTTTYTASTNDRLITADATGGAFTVTLPTASGLSGRSYTVKKTDASANAVTVGTSSSQTIDTGTTYALATQWKYVTVVSNGSNWLVVANN